MANLPRLFNADPLTFDPNVSLAVPGDLVADDSGAGAEVVGIVRGLAGGLKLVDLLAARVVVTMSQVANGALGERITALVEDRAGNPIVGAIVTITVTADPGVTILTHVAGPLGKTLTIQHSAAVINQASFLVETGVTGEASVDVTTDLASAGESYGIASYPGPGVDAVVLAFAP